MAPVLLFNASAIHHLAGVDAPALSSGIWLSVKDLDVHSQQLSSQLDSQG